MIPPQMIINLRQENNSRWSERGKREKEKTKKKRKRKKKSKEIEKSSLIHLIKISLYLLIGLF